MNLNNYILNSLQSYGFTVIKKHEGLENNLQLSESYLDYWKQRSREDEILHVLIFVKGSQKFYVVAEFIHNEETNEDVFVFTFIPSIGSTYSATNLTNILNYVLEFH